MTGLLNGSIDLSTLELRGETRLCLTLVRERELLWVPGYDLRFKTTFLMIGETFETRSCHAQKARHQ